jgi:hypothetical protein
MRHLRLRLFALRLVVAVLVFSSSAFVEQSLAATTGGAAPNMGDRCYAPTLPLTLQLRETFVDDVKPLAVKAEKDHGVPAAMLAAMAINESGYGTTQLALATHNVLSYKWNSSTGPDGREIYKLACQPSADSGNTYIVFRDRADSADFVASKLATSKYYKSATAAYRNAIANGQNSKSAATSWLKKIAPSYNPYQSDKYIAAVLKIADDPVNQSGKIDEKGNLWLLSPDQKHASMAVAASDGDVAAVAKAQKAAYAISDSTNGCPVRSTDFLGWPAPLVRQCIYEEGQTPNRRTGYVVLLDVKPEVIASWVRSVCSKSLPGANTCFDTVLKCGRNNSGMMFPVGGNLMENMENGPWKNYFFRNGMTVAIGGQKNDNSERVPLEHQKDLALMPNTAITKIPTGLTRFWRTTPRQFATRFPGESSPTSVTTDQDRNRWLAITQSEFLAALERPNNRLLEAWVSAHPRTLSAGKCPGDLDP